MFSSPGLAVALYSRYAQTHPLLLQQESAAAISEANRNAADHREKGPPSDMLRGGEGATAKVSGSTCDVFAPQSLIEQITCPICLEVSQREYEGLGFRV